MSDSKFYEVYVAQLDGFRRDGARIISYVFEGGGYSLKDCLDIVDSIRSIRASYDAKIICDDDIVEDFLFEYKWDEGECHE